MIINCLLTVSYSHAMIQFLKPANRISGASGMSDTALHRDDPRLAFAPGQRDLRHRIGWICHAIRIGAVLWIIWLLAFAVYYWSDKAQILKNYGLIFSIDLGDVSAT